VDLNCIGIKHANPRDKKRGKNTIKNKNKAKKLPN